VIVTVAGLTQWDAFGIDWRDAGRTQAGLIRGGELWRCVTALTLHADPAHLLGNIVFGCIFGWFAGQLVGPGPAWLGIVTAGGLGNLLNALIRPATHSSLGASTAVFAALGLVAAYTWSARRHSPTSAFVRWAPLVVAVVLLGYLGASGERTDVAAHVTGAISGAALGASMERWADRWRVSTRGQITMGIAALVLPVLCWMFALRG
jgi:membrane associated rhomboid family serine protease